ncbi:MAG: hypothetical protein HYV09_23005 [Deltaproteobacteria bacterium]|nr:hypothetical protein [Deltaproteobacteria bacterium]
MTRRTRIAPIIIGTLAIALGLGCGRPRPQSGVPHAVDSKVEWAPLEIEKGFDVGGREIDVIAVRGGDIVRIATDATEPVQVGERVRSGSATAESWRSARPDDGVVTVRATLLCTAILVPKGVAVRAHRATTQDPGYAWFEHEARVNAWAEGPLPAPFPAIAPPERLDFGTLAALDRVLADAVERAKDKTKARSAATAIRRVAGLRALRALRSPTGFPFFYDSLVTPGDAASRKSRELSGHKTWLVTSVDPMSVTVEGPRLLHVWSFGVRRDEDETVRLRVTEATRERAVSSGALSHARLPRASGEEGLEVPAEQAEVVSLRRAVVHVPPGSHTYAIEAHGGTAFVSASTSQPVIHVGDALAGIKDEGRQLRAARAACSDSTALCAVTMALSGEDVDAARWTAATASIDPQALKVAEALAAGGPRDPSIALELAAARGDEKALAALGAGAMRVIDDGLRAAWLRGTTRGTRWVVAEQKELADVRWLSLLFDKSDGGCTQAPDEPWTEIGKEEAAYSTSTWRGAPTLELMAAVGCGTKAPVKLEIDGQTLTPNPSSPMVKWHVLVKGDRARARRVDLGEGHVYAIDPEAAACGAHWGFITAPRVAAQRPALPFDKSVTAPGVEVWLRDGSKTGTLEVVSDADPATRARLVVTQHSGFVAVDGDGARWVRVARVGLPPWAAQGSFAVGGPDVAVRAIVRAPKGQDDVAGQAFASATPATDAVALEAEPLDEAKVIEASRQILAAEGVEQGRRYLARAMMLAVAGEARAAIEDARAAKVLGAKGAKGEDVVESVRAAIRQKPRKPLQLPTGLRAYGIEPDFDDAAPRCGPSKGPRGQLAGVVDELKVQKSAQTKVWDAGLAIRAYEAVSANAVDPRGPSILSRALAGSRWEVPKAIPGDFVKVQRLHSSPKEGPIDPDGDLRPRIGTGQPFDRASYATITESRPAKAALTGLGGAKARIEFACVARSPAEVVKTDARCPITVNLGAIVVGGGAALHPTSGVDGRGSVELPALPPKGAATYVTIGLDPAPGRWAAIARVVFDREVPGATSVPGVGWVMLPPGLQWRWLVKNDQEIAHAMSGPGLLRVDAMAEADETPKVVVKVGDREIPVTADGTPVVVPVAQPGVVRVRSIGGASTISFAERVGRPALDAAALEETEAEPALAEATDVTEPKAVTTTAVLDGGNPNGLWADTVAKSDRPLTPLEEALGTLSVRGLARTGTLRDGDPSLTERDSYFEQSVGYRRRVESIGLWTGLTALTRQHLEHTSSYGASAFLWTHLPSLRLRLAAFGDVYGQNVHGVDARTLNPHAYVEYSGRVTPSFFLLPRVGYDGVYSNIERRPGTLRGVDDNVFNEFRFRRPTTVYQQLTAWWVPFINDILFIRARATQDARHGFSHAGVRPGALFAFGNFEIGGWADATWYRATEGLRPTSKVDVTGVGYALFNIWASEGSLDIQPGIGGRMRAVDGGWEVYALVNIFASFRRGLRDFASPELAFPEQFGGNVPWRGPAVGGMR